MATAAQIPHETPGQIIARFQADAPVDIIGIADSLGLKVWEADISPYSGKIFRDPLNGGPSGFSIIVNERENPPYRKRFTIAHEVAHFILHLDDLERDQILETLYRGGLSTAKEAEANKLAANILMPYQLIEKLINEGTTSIEDLASALEVSKTAMAIRLGVPYAD